MSLGLWWRTLRRLHPAQVALRPLHLARTALLANSPRLAAVVAGTSSVRWSDAPAEAMPTPLLDLEEELARASAALGGRETLVGRAFEILSPGDDDALADAPKLARYQRGYLGVSRSLAVAARSGPVERREEASRLAIALVRDFVDRCPPGRGDAWEPYVVSIRLLNLASMRELLTPVVTGRELSWLEGMLAASLGQHARWLLATLELHLLGNHLFTNGAALYVAGAVLEGAGASTWRRVGRRLVERSLEVDLLEDGGHAERAPMYQSLVAAQLRRVAQVARRRGDVFADRADAAAGRLEAMLADVAHPDGYWPMFGDTALGEAPRPIASASASAGSRRRHFPRTGLLALRDGDDHLVIDAGPLGTRDQPGHAHADALSFELSHAGRRVVVDGGAGHYEADAWRAYFRGPFAHNGLSVDGAGPDELWAAFRAGGRARVSPLDVSRVGAFDIIDGELIASAGWHWQRRFVYAPGRVLVVVDRVEAPSASVVRSHLLLEPGFIPKAASDGASWSIGHLRLSRLAGGEWSHHRGDAPGKRGYLSRRLGVFEAASGLELRAVADGRSFIAAWALVMDDRVDLAATPEAVTVSFDGDSLRVVLSEGS
ncbi:MAG: hypothetical protein RL199_178 [Pseudomonadota bacterium]